MPRGLDALAAGAADVMGVMAENYTLPVSAAVPSAGTFARVGGDGDEDWQGDYELDDGVWVLDIYALAYDDGTWALSYDDDGTPVVVATGTGGDDEGPWAATSWDLSGVTVEEYVDPGTPAVDLTFPAIMRTGTGELPDGSVLNQPVLECARSAFTALPRDGAVISKGAVSWRIASVRAHTRNPLFLEIILESEVK